MAGRGKGQGQGEAQTSERLIAAKAKQAQALILRKSGATYQQIADQLGFADHTAALKAVKRALKATIQEPADELRALELIRLDGILLVLWPMVQRGNLAAIDRALRVVKQRAEMLGLNSSTLQHDATSDFISALRGYGSQG